MTNTERNLEVVKECGAEVYKGGPSFIYGFLEPTRIVFNPEQLSAYTARVCVEKDTAHAEEVNRLNESHKDIHIEYAKVREQLSAANAAIAIVKENIAEFHADKVRAEDSIKNIDCALSASPESIAAWEESKLLPLQEEITKLRLDLAKKHIDGIELAKMHGQGFATAVEHLCALRKQEIVSLQRQVAMQLEVIELFFNCFDILTDGPDESDEAQALGYLQKARELRSKLKADTQATAEAYEKELAENVLEDFIKTLRSIPSIGLSERQFGELERATKQVKE